MTTRSVIDCDVHCNVPSIRVLFPYLSEYWRETIEQTGFKGATDNYYPGGAALSARPGTTPESGPPGSDLGLLRTQVLDAPNVELAILNCAYAVDGIRNPYGGAAVASAINDWLVAEWLDKEPRLRASIVVTPQYPDLAANEIDRVAGHPGFVQAFLPGHSERPYGNRRYLPIFEAIVRHKLVAGIQYGGAPGIPPSASGWPTYYAEEAVGMAHIFQSQLTSLVSEGTFADFPELRITMVEGGWTWLPSTMWRLDKNWKGLRREIPWTSEPPSEYIRRHVRFTTQPVDAPPDPKHLQQIVDQLGSDDLLLYATDYPHWHNEYDHERGLPIDLSPERTRKIMSENARAWYRLPVGRPEMARFIVGTVDDIKPGERKIVEIGGRSVGVFNVNGEYFAVLNRCPHQGGSLCSGRQTGLVTSSRPGEYTTSRAGEIVRCPWHGWEFDLRTGQSWFDPRAVRVRRYDVSVEPGCLLLRSTDQPAEPPPTEAGTTPAEVAAAGGAEPDPAMGGLAMGPYTAETYPVIVEQQYVIVDTGRRS